MSWERFLLVLLNWRLLHDDNYVFAEKVRPTKSAFDVFSHPVAEHVFRVEKKKQILAHGIAFIWYSKCDTADEV